MKKKSNSKPSSNRKNQPKKSTKPEPARRLKIERAGTQFPSREKDANVERPAKDEHPPGNAPRVRRGLRATTPHAPSQLPLPTPTTAGGAAPAGSAVPVTKRGKKPTVKTGPPSIAQPDPEVTLGVKSLIALALENLEGT